MGYYKVTYNQPKYKTYQIIDKSCAADSKWHAMELTFSSNFEEYPKREYYKAKLIK